MIRTKFYKKKKGVIAVEWVILAPVILFVSFLSIMILILTMDRTLYQNSCTDLAQELNLGDTGYKSYVSGGFGLDTIVWDNQLMGSLGLSKNTGSKAVDIYVTPTGEGAFESAFYYHLNNFIADGRFHCPFSTLEKIECRVFSGKGGGTSEVYDFSTEPLKTESGDMIQVSVTYKYLVFTITDYGYSFII